MADWGHRRVPQQVKRRLCMCVREPQTQFLTALTFGDVTIARVSFLMVLLIVVAIRWFIFLCVGVEFNGEKAWATTLS